MLLPRLSLLALCVVVCSPLYAASDAPPLSSSDIAQAVTLVGKMTLDEKVSQAHGANTPGIFRATPGIADLDIPSFNFTNGPAGAGPAGAGHGGPATALPAPISLASTWDRAAARRYGEVLGKESLDLANMMIEAPDINIARQPQGGRTFEAYGEDPYLTGQLAISNIEGIQSEGEIANVKHFAANNQETNRGAINEIIDERTLREIYLPAFEAAVREGDAGSLMGAYPRINGTFCCQNSFLLDQVLRKEWGFTGFVTCDFGAMHSMTDCVQAGLDYESEGGGWYGAPLDAALSSGAIPQLTVDTMIVRRYSQMIRFGLMYRPPQLTVIPQAADGAVDRQIGAEGIVLLKNDRNILPLVPAKIHTVALIGPFATHASTGGSGSSEVKPLYTVAPLDGLQAALGPNVKVELDDGHDPAAAAALAGSCDIAIVMVGDRNGEGADQSLVLPRRQDELVSAVAAANSQTVVVLKTGSAVLMPWLNQVPAVVEAWYPGEEDGNAVADVLVGAVNPSGRLPLTFPSATSQTTANIPANFPGLNGMATYAEGVFVGYRYYDANQVQPLFPFGYGLSYSSFRFSKLALRGQPTANGTVSVSFDVSNISSRGGAEVAQVYVGIPGSSTLPEPPQQLKGFDRVDLGHDQTAHVTVTLNARSFAYWNVGTHCWTVDSGSYPVYVGDSSRNFLLRGQTVVRAAFDVPPSVCP